MIRRPTVTRKLSVSLCLRVFRAPLQLAAKMGENSFLYLVLPLFVSAQINSILLKVKGNLLLNWFFTRRKCRNRYFRQKQILVLNFLKFVF
jgi:hypothetical protein